MKYINWLIKQGCLLLFLPLIMQAQNFNTDESKVPDYTLPNVLAGPDGNLIKSVSQWETVSRPGLLKLFEEQVYGRTDPETLDISTEEKILDRTAFNGLATIKEISFKFSKDNRQTHAVLLLILPNNQEESSIFLGYNFLGNHTLLSNDLISLPSGWIMNNPQLGVFDNTANTLARGARYSRWPVLNLLKRGYGLATMYYGDIDPDFDDDFQNGVHAIFANTEKRNEASWGAIATWSWGLSRIMDFLVSQQEVKADEVILFGHSRLGKAALWAAALDQRFAMVISNNSGCGGAALSKRRFGETIAAINGNFPHWFCANFKKYNDNESAMPFDQHQLLALIAPRPLYVASAKNDSWADPKGEFLSLKYAASVFELYRKESRITGEQPLENEPLVHGSLGYHLRTGNHDVTAYDWEQFMNFAELQFK